MARGAGSLSGTMDLDVTTSHGLYPNTNHGLYCSCVMLHGECIATYIAMLHGDLHSDLHGDLQGVPFNMVYVVITSITTIRADLWSYVSLSLLWCCSPKLSGG